MKKHLRGNAITFNKGDEVTDPKLYTWCKRHHLNLDNPDKPTERDKKLIDSVRFQVKKIPQEDGSIRVVKFCPKCSMQVELDPITRPLLA